MSTLQARYGRRERPRWFWWAIASLGVVLGVTWAAWVAFDEPAVAADVWSFDVVSETRTVIVLDVRRADPVDVTCTVQAQSQDRSVVGERTVEIAADAPRRTRLEIDVETQRRAVTGVLRTCQRSSPLLD